MARQLYHLPNIRDLLLNGFTDLDLRRLCYDVPDFRPVYDELARGTGKAEIVDKLIEYAEKTLQVDTLLALAKERNPARYEEHGPYYTDDPTAALQKQVSDLAQRLSAFTSATSLTREQQYQAALHWAELGRKDSLRGFDLSGADLRGVDLAGANLCLADLCQASLHLANLEGADLRFGNLQRADLRGANLQRADLRRASLIYANLYQADLAGANLGEVCLGGANLRQVKLNSAINLDGRRRLVWSILNERIAERDLREADLGNADLHGAYLAGAWLTEANLTWANLVGTDLSRASLSKANLIHADLTGADLTGADLTGARLSGANLSNANLRQAVVDDWRVKTAMSLKGATMPDGTVHE